MCIVVCVCVEIYEIVGSDDYTVGTNLPLQYIRTYIHTYIHTYVHYKDYYYVTTNYYNTNQPNLHPLHESLAFPRTRVISHKKRINNCAQNVSPLVGSYT
jgi:hypothetical protein